MTTMHDLNSYLPLIGPVFTVDKPALGQYSGTVAIAAGLPLIPWANAPHASVRHLCNPIGYVEGDAGHGYRLTVRGAQAIMDARAEQKESGR